MTSAENPCSSALYLHI